MPGPVIDTQRELLKELDSIVKGKDHYKEVRDEKVSLFHSSKDNQSSKRLLKEIESFDIHVCKDSGKDIGKDFYPNQYPLYQYSVVRNSRFYFDFGQGFSETNVVNMKYVGAENDGEISFLYKLPKGVKNIRFNPGENGRWAVKNFTLFLDKKESLAYSIMPKNKNVITPKKKRISLYAKDIRLFFHW